MVYPRQEIIYQVQNNCPNLRWRTTAILDSTVSFLCVANPFKYYSFECVARPFIVCLLDFPRESSLFHAVLRAISHSGDSTSCGSRWTCCRISARSRSTISASSSHLGSTDNVCLQAGSLFLVILFLFLFFGCATFGTVIRVTFFVVGN